MANLKIRNFELKSDSETKRTNRIILNYASRKNLMNDNSRSEIYTKF